MNCCPREGVEPSSVPLKIGHCGLRELLPCPYLKVVFIQTHTHTVGDKCLAKNRISISASIFGKYCILKTFARHAINLSDKVRK